MISTVYWLYIQCAYECGSLMQKFILKCFKSCLLVTSLFVLWDVYNLTTISLVISHIGGRWSIHIKQQKEVYPLIQGLGS